MQTDFKTKKVIVDPGGSDSSEGVSLEAIEREAE